MSHSSLKSPTEILRQVVSPLPYTPPPPTQLSHEQKLQWCENAKELMDATLNKWTYPSCYDPGSSLRKRNDLQGKDGSTSVLRNLTNSVTTFPPFSVHMPITDYLSEAPFVFPIPLATSPSLSLSHFSSLSLADVAPLHPYLGL